MREEQSFQQMVLGQADMPMLKINMNPYLIPGKKITSSQWVIDLNVRTKSIKLLGEHIGVNLQNLGLDNNFLDMTQKSQVTPSGTPHPRWTLLH